MAGQFTDRTEAGEALADRLADLPLSDPVILALPRGGVPVAVPVARRLGAPLDLVLVRKIGAPGHEELAAGAVVNGERFDVVWNEDVLHHLSLTPAALQAAVDAKLAQIADRRVAYLGDHPPEPLKGRTAIVVDDGIATGATVKAALRGLRRRDPAAIILAVPVAPDVTLAEIAPLVDRTVCLIEDPSFHAVGEYYLRFDQVDDTEVIATLQDYWNTREGQP